MKKHDSREDYASDLSNNPYCFQIELYAFFILLFTCTSVASVYKIWIATKEEMTIGYYIAFFVSIFLVFVLLKTARFMEQKGRPQNQG